MGCPSDATELVMLEKFGAHFATTGDQDTALSHTGESVRRAMVAVLVSAAKSDDSFSDDERNQIRELVATKLSVSRAQVESFISAADSSATLDQALAELRASLNETQRQQLLACVWSIIGSDYVARAGESKFAAKLRVDLGLTLEQALQAGKIAEGVTIDGFKELVEASAEVLPGTAGWSKKE